MKLDGSKWGVFRNAAAMSKMNLDDNGKLWVEGTADANALEVGNHFTVNGDNGKITMKTETNSTIDVAVKDGSYSKAELNFGYNATDNILQLGGTSSGKRYAKVGTGSGPSTNGTGGAYVGDETGLHVFGDLLIRQGALSDESVTSADIGNHEIQAIDMAGNTTQDMNPSPPQGRRIDAAVPYLSADYLDGYSASDFLNTDSVQTGGCGFYSRGAVPHGDIKSCINKQLFEGQAQSIAGGGEWNQAKFCYNVVAANGEKWKAIVHVDVAQDSYRGATFVVVKNQECGSGGGGGGIPDDTNWINSADIIDNEITSADIKNEAILPVDIKLNGPGGLIETLGSTWVADNVTLNAIQNILQPGAGISLTPNAGKLTVAATGGGGGGGGGGGSGVTKLNNIDGAINLVEGTNITITPNGQNITIAATGSGSGPVDNSDILADAVHGNNGGAGTRSIKARSVSGGTGSDMSSDITQDTITYWNIKELTIRGAGTGGPSTGDIDQETITGWNIQNGSISGGASNANSDITGGSITRWNIANGTIYGDGVGIGDGGAIGQIGYQTITNWNIKPGVISGDNLAGDSVESRHIVEYAVRGDMADGVAWSDTGDNGEIAPDTITGWNIKDQTITGEMADGIPDNALGGDTAPATITGWNIKNGTIKGGGSNFLASGDIDMETITGWNLAPNSVTADKIANGEIGPDDLADDSVNSAK